MATPKLRFKEFDGYLEKNNLINLTLWASGGTPSKKNKDYLLVARLCIQGKYANQNLILLI